MTGGLESIPSTDEAEAPSLVERTREETRRAVSAVLWPMYARRGFDAVSVNEAAQAAGISRASFFRYFQSKEDSVLAAADPVASHVAAAILDLEAGASWLAVQGICAEAATSYLDDPAASIEWLRLIRSHPSLRACELARERRAQDSLLRINGDPAGSFAPRVTAAAAMVVLDCATSAWVESDGALELLALIADGFTLLDRPRA